MLDTAIQFLREARQELRKVTWPTPAEARSVTVVVIVFVFICAAYLGAVDWVFGSGIRYITN